MDKNLLEEGKILEIPLAGTDVMLEYHRQGTGQRVMLTFHGFGQTGADMHPVSAAMGEAYTTYHINLFFHGRSLWPADSGPLEKEQWGAIIRAFLQAEGISRFSMTAFSMGGKFALATLELFADRIDALILIAPDGIRISPWYRLATGSIISQSYFRYLITHPSRIFRLSQVLYRLGLLDRGTVRFVTSEMNTSAKREKVCNTWLLFRKLRFSMKDIGRLISENNIRLTIITGRYDRIIRTRHMNRLIRAVANPELLVAESGHNHLVSRGMREFQQKNV